MKRSVGHTFALLFGFLITLVPHRVEAGAPCHPTQEALSGKALFEIVQTYTRFGSSGNEGIRTGTRASHRFINWLKTELNCLGIDTTLDRWSFRQYALKRCHLVLDGRPVQCLPLWFPNTTRLRHLPISGTTLEPGKAATVTIRGYAQDGKEVGAVIADAITRGARGVIAVNSSHRSITSINSSLNAAESPPSVPVVMVGNQDSGWVSAAKNIDLLELMGKTRRRAKTSNLIGRWLGSIPTTRKIVISTPVNGWYQNGGERGPGLALFLGLARWVALHRPQAEFMFVATSGHELGGMGSQRFLADASAFGITPENVTAWIHLGASIATWNYSPLENGQFVKNGVYLANLDYSHPGLRPYLSEYLSPLGYAVNAASPQTSGELAMIMDRGFNAFGFYGAFAKFHTLEDQADSTAPELLEPVLIGLEQVIEAIIASN